MIPCCTSQNIEEFWSVLTRPADRNGYGMPAEAVLMRVRSLESKFRLLPELPSVHPTWRRLLLVHGVTGSHVRDAHLAASMIVHGVRRILTFNTKEFSRFSAVQPLHPRDFVRASQQ